MDRLLLIQTGGTIDKDYPKSIGGYEFEIGLESAAKRVLERVQPTLVIESQVACRKDSQDITDEDRQTIFQICSESEYSHVLITHGTDTIIETAKYLAVNNVGKAKKVILTGAFKPEMFKDSDAEFNIGVAIGALQCGPPTGVFVAMNGCVFQWNEVARDLDTGKFIHKST